MYIKINNQLPNTSNTLSYTEFYCLLFKKIFTGDYTVLVLVNNNNY